ncbi:SepSecS/SepCysS family [Trypanosoma melophagium]|uniref:SepSecS/SepCysS family n=1 Tax=Trypanosoma melophagium TaxID=715481 RepID=UPI00351A128D|nr:SepSecS/SepCysS family [Trypanosoma melophagium]
MDNRSLSLAETLVAAPYIRAGAEALQATHSVIHSIIAQRRCLESGMSDTAIELLLHQLAMMDTNNFAAHVGAGEREGRVAVSLVARRHYGFTHGIGRSGDVTRDQPKAAGSSLLYKITNYMILDLLRLAGTPSLQEAVVVPMATGMTLALLLRSIAQHRQTTMQLLRTSIPSSSEGEQDEDDEESLNKYDMEERVVHHASGKQDNNIEKKVVNGNNSSEEFEPRYVIWTRIDQKTALKCIEAAGLLSLPVPLRHASWQKCGRNSNRNGKSRNNHTFRERKNDKVSLHPYFLQSHVDDIAAAISRIGGPRAVVCVLTTTSCFAPRLPDDVLAIARLCKVLDVPHVVNNAYGVQSRTIMQRLDAAIRLGRVDAIVQSGDKNFLVPVGGAVISGKAEVVARAAALYAGRASASPIVDIFITALSLGRSGFQQLWKGRYKLRERFEAALQKFACDRGEELLAEQMGDDTYNNTNKVADINTPRNNTPTPTVVAAATTMNNSTTNTTITTDTTPVITVPPRNDISFAITMRTVGGVEAAKEIGARLFRSAVTGPRVVVPDSSETRLCGHLFRNYGMHTDETPPCPMLVMACGIGMTEGDMNGVMERLEKLWPVNNGKITTKGEEEGLKKSRSGSQGRSHLK